MKDPIDWAMIAAAVGHYGKQYQYLEVPWIVSDEAAQATLPTEANGYKAFVPIQNEDEGLLLGSARYLVGSAEQGFIQMMLDGTLKKGKYCAAGPCFRDDVEDKWHSQTFFKVELIDFDPDNESSLSLLKDAKDFMEMISNCQLDILKTQDGIDLMCNGIEVGSYGYRQYKDFKWIYGTGLALPRFSKVKYV